jgi:regulator of sigma D
MNAPVSPAATVLNDLVATMQAIKNLYDKPGELTDTQDRQLSMLDNRRFALEDQLQQMVKDTLGVDYAVLWHAVTPSGPIPKLP